MVVSRNGFITLAGWRIQKERCPKGAPSLLGPRFADRLQPEQILFAELEGSALPREGHDSLKHKLGQTYRYLENADLAAVNARDMDLAEPRALRAPAVKLIAPGRGASIGCGDLLSLWTAEDFLAVRSVVSAISTSHAA
jgi:hypothetical protein